MKQNWFDFNEYQARLALAPSLLQVWDLRWMAWRGWFSLAWLEYSHYGGLACSVGLVYHGLHYSSPGINKPVTKRSRPKSLFLKNRNWGGRSGREEDGSGESKSSVLGPIRSSPWLEVLASHAAKPVTPSDLWVHRRRVSELIYVCLFYLWLDTSFHLFIRSAWISGNNTGYHSFQLQEGKFGVAREMVIRHLFPL